MTRFRYSGAAWRLFSLAFRPRMKLGIRETRVAGLPPSLPREGPLLLVSNHVSWWDGFILRPVQQLLRPGEALHIVMLEEELARRPFLRRLGGIGLIPGSTGSMRSLLRDLSAERDRDPAFSVLFFPQGRIWPSYRRPLGFRGGVRLLARSLAPVTVLPVGLHLEGGKHMAATAFVSIGDPIGPGDTGPEVEQLEHSVSAELDAIHQFLGEAGEDADDHWPTPGDRLPRASAKAFGQR